MSKISCELLNCFQCSNDLVCGWCVANTTSTSTSSGAVCLAGDASGPSPSQQPNMTCADWSYSSLTHCAIADQPNDDDGNSNNTNKCTSNLPTIFALVGCLLVVASVVAMVWHGKMRRGQHEKGDKQREDESVYYTSDHQAWDAGRREERNKGEGWREVDKGASHELLPVRPSMIAQPMP